MGEHAICSASSSKMWINCNPSALLNACGEDKGSVFAKEGTDAHALCEYLVKNALGMEAENPIENLSYYDAAMLEHAEGYRNFVLEQVEEMRKDGMEPYIGIEQRLDFSKWVPEGFGTGDIVLVTDGLIHIIDFKYGAGVLVDPKENPQLMCYALGALDTFWNLYPLDRVRLTIYQPRRENVSTWETGVTELLSWAEGTLRPAAEKAMKGEGDFNAGEHCRFCRIRETCRARAEKYLELMREGYRDPPEMSIEEISAILPKVEGMAVWAEDVKNYALKEALNGTAIDGYKLVEGRSVRKYTDEALAARAAEDAGVDPYERKILGITAMQKALGKKRFEEILGPLTVKAPGKPTLVPESDKRKAMTNITNQNFTEECENE